MVDDLQWELALLATVQSFYQRLLGERLGGELPAPAGLSVEDLSHPLDIRSSHQHIQLWIKLLDMAITPAMLRFALHADLDPEIAEALLRYFAGCRDDSAANRDKTDLVATFLFRYPRVPGQWDRRGYGLDGSIPLAPFEIALLEILSESEAPTLSDEDVQTLREFSPLLEQANRFQDFTALIDSGMIQRVRELKAKLGEAIYHPGVLATLAPYNSAFRERFQVLFAAAAAELKEFADRLDEMGGSILSTVDGMEVTVEHIAALDQEALLQSDYSEALERFRRVSRLKKELERRPPIRPLATDPHTVGAGGAAVAPAPRRAADPVTAQALALEETKIRRVEESIRVFVRVADPKFRQVVPMRYFNLTLTPEEMRACTADYLEQSGPRSAAARVLLRIVALSARLMTETEELKRSANSPSVKRLHADSLAVLVELAKRVAQTVHHGDPVLDEAASTGLGESAGESLRTSLETLRQHTAEAVTLVAG